jgi:hypothetical protein
MEGIAMRKTLLAIAALTVATPALADDWDFVLINSSGKEIKLIEISPTGASTWVKNREDEGVKKAASIKSGGRMTVHFDKAGNQCRYDVRGTFMDDTTAIWANINVCDNAYVTIKYSAAGAPTFTAN